MFKVLSSQRYETLRKRKLDFLYKMSPYEWRGTLNNGQNFILLEYKLLLVQIDVQKREMELGISKRAVLSLSNKPFYIYKCCDFF